MGAKSRTRILVSHSPNGNVSKGVIAVQQVRATEVAVSIRSQLGLSATIERLSIARRLPSPLVTTALMPYAGTGYLHKHGLDAERLSRTLSLPVDPLATHAKALPCIDVVIPCGPSDVGVLPGVIESAPKGTTNSIRKIQVIAPPTIISPLKNAVGAGVDFVDENDLLGAAVISMIGTRFPTRRNWVLQQAVKVASVLASQADGVLVLDADTLLLRPRTWLTSDGRQILTPTIEWHQPYYDFLRRLSRGQWRTPTYSFVPHHMLMQPQLMARLLADLGIDGLDGLVSTLGHESDYETESMFCIEYELYAQGILNRSPTTAVLAKWSNRNVPRERRLPINQAGPYMSVSQHHYL